MCACYSQFDIKRCVYNIALCVCVLYIGRGQSSLVTTALPVHMLTSKIYTQ